MLPAANSSRARRAKLHSQHAATDRPPASEQIAPNGLPNFNAYSGSNGGANAPESSAQSGQFIPPRPRMATALPPRPKRKPNHGDGNRDGITDANQRDVASLRAKTDGSFVTLESPGHTLTNVERSLHQTPRRICRSVCSRSRFTTLRPAAAATVNMILPEGFTTNSYLKQDSTGALQPFDFDGTTGAVLNGNMVTLHFIDGGRGDADGVANGTILDPGGPNSPIGVAEGSQAVLQFSSATYAVFKDAGPQRLRLCERATLAAPRPFTTLRATGRHAARRL